MIFYGLLKRLTQKWDVDPEGGLQNALLARQGAIESTEVANALLRLACQIEAHPALREVFTASVPTEALKTLREYPDVQSAFDRFLERYGDRCVGELKLETVSPRENPVDCVPILQGYLRQGVGRVSLAATPDMDPQAELRLRLGGKRFLGVIPKLFLYRWVLRHTKNAVRNRENQRLARTRAYGLVRGLFRSIGRSFQSSGVLDKAEDIFFLDMDEIFAFIEGRSLTIDLRALVGARRKEYDGFLGQPSPPDHFETRGPVYLDLAFEQPSPTQGGTLQGLGACPGVVTGHALVMLEPDPSRVFEGCILVARQTDPGWVSVFPSIKGLVVERGSMLSHSAIVAREMGIPAVVGVPHAASRIETGDTIRLDGRTGRVEIIGGPS
jgi:pyruvate,water dikinase